MKFESDKTKLDREMSSQNSANFSNCLATVYCLSKQVSIASGNGTGVQSRFNMQRNIMHSSEDCRKSIKETHVFLRLPADEAGLAVVARPSVSLKVPDQIVAVDAARGVNGSAATKAAEKAVA
jgi:hypothetical protein